MSREYNYGGTSLIVDSIDEIFESGAVSTKTVNNIKQIIGQQKQSKDINKLKEQIGGAAEDGTISASEKPGLNREWASLQASYSSISDKFAKDDNLSSNTFYALLNDRYGKLSPIMGEILADMNTDYTNKEKVSKITDLFVQCWEYIAKCSKALEDNMSFSDRYSLQVSPNREIVSNLSIKANLLFYSNGSWSDVTNNTEAYPESDFVWEKASDENFKRTGRTLELKLSDFSSSEESFILTFKHVSYYEDSNNTQFSVEKKMSFSVVTGTLSQWAWSDADSKEGLLADATKVWTAERTETNGKSYLWRRDTKDVLKIDSEKEWTYFRESGKDGTSVITQYRLSASNKIPPTDTTVFNADGGATMFDGMLLVNAVDGWVDEYPSPTADYPFVWQRTSKDNGITWGTPICTNPGTNEYLDVVCSPNFYTLNSRGVNDKLQNIDVYIDRTFIPSDFPCYIQLSYWHGEDSEVVPWFEHNASASYRIEIPEYITYDRIIVEVSCGNQNRAISIDAVKSKYTNGEKQLGVVYLKGNVLYRDSEHTQPIPYLNDDPSMPFAEGDYALVGDGDDLIPYRYTDRIWTAVSSDITNGQDYADIMLNTLVDILVIGKDVKKSMSAHYAFIAQLAAQSATIEKIFSQHIKILNEGSIYAGGFNEKGENETGSVGFYIDSTGKMQLVEAVMDKVEVNGSVKCEDDNGIVLKTQYGSSAGNAECSPKERWNQKDLCSAIALGNSGTGTFNSTSYSYKRANSSNMFEIMNFSVGPATGVDYLKRFVADCDMTLHYKLPSYRDGFSYGFSALYITRANSTTLERVYYNESGSTATGTISVKAGDEIRAGVGSSSGVGFGSIVISCIDDGMILSTTKTFSYGGGLSNTANVPQKILRNTDGFYSLSCSIGSFDSSNNIKYASPTGWWNGLKDGANSIDNSVVRINGVDYTINSTNKSSTGLVVASITGKTFTLSLGGTAEGVSTGWYDISGTLALLDETRGVKVESLIPTSETTSIGDASHRFSTVFSKAVDVDGNINAKEITGTKVWRAVFN